MFHVEHRKMQNAKMRKVKKCVRLISRPPKLEKLKIQKGGQKTKRGEKKKGEKGKREKGGPKE